MELRMNTPDIKGFDLPAVGSRVYFELDYKSNVDFYIGIILNNNEGQKYSVLGVNAKTTWNKIYLDLTNEFIKILADNKFKLYIAVNKSEVGPTDFNFDNLKLIYFD
jgi:hypothetical protein